MNRPNFVLFMPETLRADAVLGARESRAKTPNIDRLAGEGAAFTNCFAQNPICSPSRCSMFTGIYPHTRGHRSLMTLLQPDQRNLFRDLKDAGYRNVVYGKNDLLSQDSIPLCFDEVDMPVAPEEGCEPEPYPDDSRWKKSFYAGKRPHEDCHDHDWAAIQSAISFLNEDHDRPFCLYLPMAFAHPTYRVEEPFFSMHDIASIPEPIPGNYEGKRSYMPAIHKAHGLERLSTDDFKEIKRVYYGMVSRVDHQLGLLIDTLKARGLYDNTVMVLFSDHGDYAGDFGMVEKFVAGFEDCLLNVPLVMRGPGIGTSGQHAHLCEMTDLYPTLLELAGLESQHYHFGRSLLPVVSEPGGTHRDVVYAAAGHHPDEASQFHVTVPPGTLYHPMLDVLMNEPIARRAVMARTDKWKYVHAPGDREELYDMGSDPREIVNLATDPTHSGVLSEMRELLLRGMIETSDVLPERRDSRAWS